MGTGGTTQLSPLDLVKVCSGQRQPIALRFQLALLGRFRIRPVTQSASPLGQVSIPSKLYRRQEHFRVTKHTRVDRFFLP